MSTFTWRPTVLSNTGCQLRFFPLLAFNALQPPDLSQTLWDDVGHFADRHTQLLADENVATHFEELRTDARRQGWSPWKDCSFVKMRLSVKKFRTPQTNETFDVLGVELAIETTAPGERFNECGFLRNTQMVLNNAKDAPQFPSVYQRVPDGASYPPQDQTAYDFEVGDVPPLISVSIRIGFRGGIVANGPLGAHLVIDIGNTRTSALFLKDEPTGLIGEVEAIRSDCKPVMLDVPTKTEAVTKADLLNVDNGIVGSWIMLHQTEFDEDEPSVVQRRYVQKTVKKWFGLKEETFNAQEEQRIPTMFVRYSPVVFGREARNFLSLPAVTNLIEKGLQIQQSSPKRYFADRRKTRLVWSMVPNVFGGEIALDAHKLRSDLLYWMNEAGEFVDPDKTELAFHPLRDPKMPNYPRAATFVWMLVGILERAWEQCNHLTDPNAQFTPYEIKDVIVTYPSGWTRDEIEIYKQRCREAVQIFERTNFSSNDQIRLNMDVDEAVASQLPYVFSEIHKHKDNANGWLKFVGKKRGGGEPTFRIMTFDIGGGTTDLSVVEYSCRETSEDGLVDLQPKLLFRDGYSQAGDELMRQLISRVVFAAVEKANPRAGAELRKYFSGKVPSAVLQAKRSKDLRLNIMPLAIQIMRELSSGTPSGRFTLEKAGVDRGRWVEDLYRNLQLQDVLSEEDWWRVEIEYDVTSVNALIREFFEDSIANAATIADQYDVDLFFMSGKTSELPEIRNLAKEHIPVTNDRIVSAKNYCAGDWYPFVKTDERGVVVENTIQDAKSITAVGAALNFLLANRRISGWKIERTVMDVDCCSQWGFQSAFAQPDGNPFVFDENDEATIVLDEHCVISRRLSMNAISSAVYRLQNRDPNTEPTTDRFEARIRRGRDEATKAEFLELVSLTKGEEKTDCLGRYELAVCQNTELFWQDSGCVES